jgi:o-succinylbenzoate---CoA ligase
VPSPPEFATHVVPNSTHRCYERLRRTIRPETPLCVVYTSGTTGEPKGVILSRRAFEASAREAKRWLRLVETDRWFLSLPLAHVGGLSVLLRTWLTHSSVVLAPIHGQPFDPVRFVAQCRSSDATLVSLVPTQLQRICAAALSAPPTLRCVLLGGAPTPPSLWAQAQQLGFRVARTYGLTELCSLVATDKLELADMPPSVPPASLIVHSHAGARLNPEGRLMLRSEAMFSGYWGQSVKAPTDWFTTEDLAELVNDEVRILGRSDDVIITGGEKVHPAQVEAALLTCPGQACVFGRPSDEWGQEVCAALVMVRDFDVSAVVSHLRRCLPSFNIPRAWTLASQLPTTPNGKTNRRHIAASFGPLCQYI